jgi:hypothetical protein
MVAGFTTIHAISVYHHWCCEFESLSGRGVQHYVIAAEPELVLMSPICKHSKNIYNFLFWIMLQLLPWAWWTNCPGLSWWTKVDPQGDNCKHDWSGFTTIHAISVYHHWCCEFESLSGRGVQHYVIKFVSDLRQIGGFLRVLRFPPPRYNWKCYNCYHGPDGPTVLDCHDEQRWTHRVTTVNMIGPGIWLLQHHQWTVSLKQEQPCHMLLKTSYDLYKYKLELVTCLLIIKFIYTAVCTLHVLKHPK